MIEYAPQVPMVNQPEQVPCLQKLDKIHLTLSGNHNTTKCPHCKQYIRRNVVYLNQRYGTKECTGRMFRKTTVSVGMYMSPVGDKGKKGKAEHLSSAFHGIQTTLKCSGMDHTV